MSYNCDTFKVKKLENLKIPIKYLLSPERTDWAFEREENYNEDNEIESTTFTNMDSDITGIVENGTLTVKEICISGEGSGTIFYDILEPALKDSKGELIASCVWEGGDSINQIIVKDGNVTWKDIDI